MRNSAHNRWKLLACAVSIAVAVISSPASADWIRTKMEAQDSGSRVRVRIWVSASVGLVNVEDHYIGGYNVPHGTGLKATLGIGTAIVDLKLEAQDELVEAVVNIHVEGFDDQTSAISSPIKE